MDRSNGATLTPDSLDTDALRQHSMALTNHELVGALHTAAELIDLHGEAFAPILERLIREGEIAREKASARDRAAALARQLKG